MKHISLILFFISGICCNSLAQKNDTITTASGLKYFLTHKGTGPAFKPGRVGISHYILTLADGTKIDNSRERNEPMADQYPSKNYINGYNEAISLLHVGDRGTFILPPAIGYGDKGWRGIVPPNATLVFDIELLDIRVKKVQMVLDNVMFGKPARPDSIPHTTETIAAYRKLKKVGFKKLYSSEQDLNSIGYEIIKKHPKDAIEIFKLNVEMYPKSSNAYDSLAEAYMDAGDTALAIANYETSFKLEPKNTNALDMIKKMKGETTKP